MAVSLSTDVYLTISQRLYDNCLLSDNCRQFPQVAPDYAKVRSRLAKKIGLGRVGNPRLAAKRPGKKAADQGAAPGVAGDQARRSGSGSRQLRWPT